MESMIIWTKITIKIVMRTIIIQNDEWENV